MKTNKIFPISAFMFLLVSIPLVLADEICIDRITPTAPSNLVITDSPYDVDGNIQLDWTAATDQPDCSGVDHYNIYRSDDGVNFTLIGTSMTTSYSDASSLPAGTYWYRITAVDKVAFMPNEGPAVEGSTIVDTTPTTTTTQPSSSGGSSGGGGGGGGGGAVLMQPCELNGVCDSWETHETCPSDCPAETTTTVPSGEATTTTTTTVPPTTTTTTNEETATTSTLPTLAFSAITGMFAALTGNSVYIIVFILIAAAVILVIFRKRIPKILKVRKHYSRKRIPKILKARKH